jgi:hypothetical protein
VAEFQVDPYGIGTPITGYISSYGKAEIDEAIGFGRAYATGMASVEIRGGDALADGTIEWMPTMRDVVADSVSAGFQLDPISFVVEDAGGVVGQGTFLSISVDLERNNDTSRFGWENGVLEISAGEAGEFKIDMINGWVSSPRFLELSFDGTEITSATTIGTWSTVLPSVGTPLPVSINLSNLLTVAYDLGPLPQNATVTLFLGGIAESDFPLGDQLVAASEDELPQRARNTLEASPNPFNPRIEVRYSLTRSGPVRLDVFDARGHHVRTLVDQYEDAGPSKTTWSGTDSSNREVSSGVYLLRLQTVQGAESMAVTLVR